MEEWEQDTAQDTVNFRSNTSNTGPAVRKMQDGGWWGRSRIAVGFGAIQGSDRRALSWWYNRAHSTHARVHVDVKILAVHVSGNYFAGRVTAPFRLTPLGIGGLRHAGFVG